MPLIQNLPVSLDKESLLKMTEWKKDSSEFLFSTVELLRPKIRPRAAWTSVTVQTNEKNRIKVGGLYFKSRLLSRCVGKSTSIFPYLITLGERVETELMSTKDLLSRYIMEKTADLALLEAGRELKRILEMRFGNNLASLSPGSLEDWPLEEQTVLFSMLGEWPAKLGVILMDSMMMVPRKSLSGVFFIAPEGFLSCRLCSRHHCDQRQACYDPEITNRYLG